MDNSEGGKSCTTIIRWDLTLYKQPWLEEIICKVSRTVLGEVQERPTEFWKTGGNTTQQHHRIIDWQLGRDLWRSSLPTFCSKQGLLQSKVRFLRVLSKRASIISRDAESRDFLVPMFNDPHYEKKALFYTLLEFPLLQLVSTSTLSQCTSKKSLCHHRVGSWRQQLDFALQPSIQQVDQTQFPQLPIEHFVIYSPNHLHGPVLELSEIISTFV